MSTTPPTIRWGILATGGIAQTFTKDLLVDPKTRGVDTVIHTVVAAASSSSKSRAEQFLKEVGAPSSAQPYGSYNEFVKDPNIDIVYIATPHSHHFQNAMLCLEAGKNVLCEKAFTVNAAQAKLLVKKAKEKVRTNLEFTINRLILTPPPNRTSSSWKQSGRATSPSPSTSVTS